MSVCYEFRESLQAWKLCPGPKWSNRDLRQKVRPWQWSRERTVPKSKNLFTTIEYPDEDGLFVTGLFPQFINVKSLPPGLRESRPPAFCGRIIAVTCRFPLPTVHSSQSLKLWEILYSFLSFYYVSSRPRTTWRRRRKRSKPTRFSSVVGSILRVGLCFLFNYGKC